MQEILTVLGRLGYPKDGKEFFDHWSIREDRVFFRYSGLILGKIFSDSDIQPDDLQALIDYFKNSGNFLGTPNDEVISVFVEKYRLHRRNYLQRPTKHTPKISKALLQVLLDNNFLLENFTSLHHAIVFDNYGIVKMLFKNGFICKKTEIDPDILDDIAYGDMTGGGYIHTATDYTTLSSPEMLQILVSNGINVNELDSESQTALHYLCDIRQPKRIVSMVKKIIELGVNIDVVNHYGNTALMFLFTQLDMFAEDIDEYENPENIPKIIRVLLDSGADISIKNKHNQLTALQIAQKKLSEWNSHHCFDSQKKALIESIEILKEHQFQKNIISLEDNVFSV